MMAVQGIVSTTEVNGGGGGDDDEVGVGDVAMYLCPVLRRWGSETRTSHNTHTHSIYVVSKVILGLLKDLNSFSRSCWGWCN